MPVQLTYSADQQVGFPGLFRNLKRGAETIGVNGEASTEIPFGVFVKRKPGTDNGALLPSAANDVLWGAVLHSHRYTPEYDVGPLGLKPGVGFGLAEGGDVLFRVEEAVANGDPVYVRFAAKGGNTQRGAVRKTPDDGTTATAFLLKGAKFRSAAQAGGLAYVEFDTFLNHVLG